MDLSLLRKLHEIIYSYASHLFGEGLQWALDANIKYPYEGPAFTFKIERDHLLLINNTIKVYEKDLGCVEEIHSCDFLEPKRNQIEAAFLKFRYWENKIHSAYESLQYPDALRMEREIMTGKLLRLAIDMLNPIAESYSLRMVDPDAGQVYWAYPGQQPVLYDRENEYSYQLAAFGLNWHHVWGLKIGDTAPAKLQLKIEEFNDLLKETDEEIKSCYNQSSAPDPKPYHPAREIVQSIQMLIYEWTQDIYTTRRAHAEYLKVKYPYDGPVVQLGWKGEEFFLIELDPDPVGKLTIALSDGRIFEMRGIEGSFCIPKLTEIKNDLLRFEFYRMEVEREIKESPGSAGITLIKDKLVPIAAEVLGYVSSSYDFDANKDPDGEADFKTGANPAKITNGKFYLDNSLPPAIALKIEQLNYRIEKYQESIDVKAAYLLTTPVSAWPAAFAEIDKEYADIKTEPATTAPAIPPAPQADSQKSKKKTREPNDTEKIIIHAINETEDGLPALDRLCVLLDSNKETKPRWTWKEKAKYPWPGKYVTAWNSRDGRAQRYWRKLIRKYVDDTKKAFIKVTKSPR